VANRLRPLAREVRLIEGNIAEAATRAAFVAAVEQAGGRCDRLVHCVALTSFKPLAKIRANQWDLILQVSARSLLDLVVALDQSLAAAAGSVVAISSHGSVRFIPDYGALGVAKAALEATVRQLACEFAPRGVRVNAVRAGLVDGAVLAHFPDGMRAAVLERTPRRRLTSADEVAAAAEFLLGPMAAGIVGQVLDVDGGFSLT
jgi:enoyl-[acyl-carrier protein] reductase III